VGRVLPWHRGEARQGEDGQEVTGRPVQGDLQGAGVEAAQARDAAGLSGAERFGAGDQAGVELPARRVLLVVEPFDGGDEVGGGDLTVDRRGVADPGAQPEGVGAPVGRELGEPAAMSGTGTVCCSDGPARL
jgi:hypothetical protein